MIDPHKTRVEGCPAVDAWLHVCHIGRAGQPGEVVLLGDSHAYALASALDERLAQDGKSGFVVHTSCHPIDGLFDSRETNSPARLAYCAEAHRRLLDFVARPEIRSVLVAIRWTARLYPMDGRIDGTAFDNGEGGIEQDFPYRRNLALDAQGRLSDAAAPKAMALRSYLTRLAALKPTVVLDPVPEVGWTPTRLNLLAITAGQPPPEWITTSSARYRARNAEALGLLASLPATHLRRSQPQTLLCDRQVPGRCVVQAQRELFYSDDDHLSMLGARWVVADMLAQSAAIR